MPDSPLQAPFATSSFADIAPGTRFLRFIPETNPDIFAQDDGDQENADVRRLVLCSGKIYYDIVRAREEKGTATSTSIYSSIWGPFSRGLFLSATPPTRRAV